MYKKYSSINRTDVKNRIDRYNEKSAGRRNAVVCVNCGSTRIDQNALHELRCYDCDEFMPWNGLRFTISRQNEGVDDVGFALQRLLRSSYDEWHKQLEDGLYLFLQEVVLDAGKQEKFSRERLDYLWDHWNRCKHVVDMYFKDRREFDEELD